MTRTPISRDGGISLAMGQSREQIQSIIEEDLFVARSSMPVGHRPPYNDELAGARSHRAAAVLRDNVRPLAHSETW